MTFFAILQGAIHLQAAEIFLIRCESLFIHENQPSSKPNLAKQAVTKLLAAFLPDGFTSQLERPADGIGHTIIIDVDPHQGFVFPFEMRLQKMAKAFPYFFSRFEIHADGGKISLPSTERLNLRTQNGIQFVDVPVYRNQFYNDGVFRKFFAKRLIPWASYGRAFLHDYLEEHLAGILIMPKWLYDNAYTYFLFEQEWLNSKTSKQYPSTTEMTQRWNSTGHLWDHATGNLGKFISDLSEKKIISTEDINELVEILRVLNDSFKPGNSSVHLLEFLNQTKPKGYEQIVASRAEQGKSFAHIEKSDKELLAEALSIIQLVMENTSGIVFQP